MTNYMKKLPVETIAQLTRNLKAGVLQVLDMPPEEMRKGDIEKKQCPPEAAFHVGMAGIVAFEREIRRRGLDPSDPIFGPDIVPEIAQIWAEELAGI